MLLNVEMDLTGAKYLVDELTLLLDQYETDRRRTLDVDEIKDLNAHEEVLLKIFKVLDRAVMEEAVSEAVAMAKGMSAGDPEEYKTKNKEARNAAGGEPTKVALYGWAPFAPSEV